MFCSEEYRDIIAAQGYGYYEVLPYDNLYIIEVFDKNGYSMIKFGYSSVIHSRLSSYYNHNPLMKIIYTTYHPDAKEIESAFHKTNKSVILREWYEKSDEKKIVRFINKWKY